MRTSQRDRVLGRNRPRSGIVGEQPHLHVSSRDPAEDADQRARIWVGEHAEVTNGIDLELNSRVTTIHRCPLNIRAAVNLVVSQKEPVCAGDESGPKPIAAIVDAAPVMPAKTRYMTVSRQCPETVIGIPSE